MTRELTAEHRRVLTILAGCPDGATASCLTQFNRVAHTIIAELVGRELIDAQVQYVATSNSNRRAISVVRLRITAAGRTVITALTGSRAP
jgi:molybdopterin biosynthesis enzyme